MKHPGFPLFWEYGVFCCAFVSPSWYGYLLHHMVAVFTHGCLALFFCEMQDMVPAAAFLARCRTASYWNLVEIRHFWLILLTDLTPLLAAKTARQAGMVGIFGPQELMGSVQPWFRWGSFSCCCLDEFPGRNSNHSANVMCNSLEETTFQIIWRDNQTKQGSWC